MKIDLDRADLISLAKGNYPMDQEALDHKLIDKNGKNDFESGWEWHFDCFEEESDEQIYSIYLICKESKVRWNEWPTNPKKGANLLSITSTSEWCKRNHHTGHGSRWAYKLRNVECPLLKANQTALYDIEITYCGICGENFDVEILQMKEEQ